MTEPDAPRAPQADLLTGLSELFSRAGRDPFDGLRFWTDVVFPRFDAGRGGDDLAHRTFERLAGVVEAAATPDQRAGIDAAVGEARRALGAALDRDGDRALRARRGFARGARRALGGTAAKSRRPSFRELQDLLLLEEQLDRCSGLECLLWLDRALREARAAPMRAHLAFAPLRLLPSDRLVEQVAGALAEGMEANLNVPIRIREALITHLAQDRPVQDPEDLPIDEAFWRLLANLAPEVSVVADARRYLGRLPSPRGRGSDRVARVVAAVCETVDAARPSSASQSAFFLWLKRDRRHWSADYAVFGLRALRLELRDSLPADAIAPRQVEHFRDEIDAALASGDRDLLEMMAAELDESARLGEGPSVVRRWRGKGAAEAPGKTIFVVVAVPAGLEAFRDLKELVLA